MRKNNYKSDKDNDFVNRIYLELGMEIISVAIKLNVVYKEYINNYNEKNDYHNEYGDIVYDIEELDIVDEIDGNVKLDDDYEDYEDYENIKGLKVKEFVKMTPEIRIIDKLPKVDKSALNYNNDYVKNNINSKDSSVFSKERIDMLKEIEKVGYKINRGVFEYILKVISGKMGVEKQKELKKYLCYDETLNYTEMRNNYQKEIKKYKRSKVSNKSDMLKRIKMLKENYKSNLKILSQTMVVKNILILSYIFLECKEFYIPVRCDYRGRIYPNTKYLHYQG